MSGYKGWASSRGPGVITGGVIDPNGRLEIRISSTQPDDNWGWEGKAVGRAAGICAVALNADKPLRASGYDALRVMEAVPGMVRLLSAYDTANAAAADGDCTQERPATDLHRQIIEMVRALRTDTPAPAQEAAGETGGPWRKRLDNHSPALLREHADFMEDDTSFIGSNMAIARALRWGADAAEREAALRTQVEGLAAERDFLADETKRLAGLGAEIAANRDALAEACEAAQERAQYILAQTAAAVISKDADGPHAPPLANSEVWEQIRQIAETTGAALTAAGRRKDG